MSIPRIAELEPAAALPGGDVCARGEALFSGSGRLPELRVGGMHAPLLVAGPRSMLFRVPEGALTGPVEIDNGNGAGGPVRGPQLEVAVTIAENLHPVCNPAVDAEGNIIATLSGRRGQKTPVSLFRLDTNYSLKAWNSTIVNPSGLAFDREGGLFVSSRHEGAIYRVTPNGSATQICEGLGAATGIALDADDNVYIGDRSGTIFKLDRQRKTFVFATLEPSVAAYHLAFGADGYLYVCGPSTSSYDTIWRISPAGEVEAFFRGLGRPQGIAFDARGELYVVASYRGRRGVVQIGKGHEPRLVVAGPGLVGLAFAHGPAMILASIDSLYHLSWPTPGRSLPPVHSNGGAGGEPIRAA